MTLYGDDALDRRTSQQWLAAGKGTATPGQASLVAWASAHASSPTLATTNTIVYTYDLAGQLTATSDAYSAYTFTYDVPERVTSTSNAGTPHVPTTILDPT